MIEACPVCDTATIDSRTTKTPTYRCENGHTFETPDERNRYRQVATDATDQELLDEIQRVTEIVDNTPPTKTEVSEYATNASSGIYQSRFGSGRRAVKKAGFKPREPIDCDDRPESCQMCNTVQSGLDFHHWNYRTERGCHLCRDCHDKVHEGGAHPKTTVDWLQGALANTVYYHLENGGTENAKKIEETYSLTSRDGGLTEYIRTLVESHTQIE
jgi:hypothetical protein